MRARLAVRHVNNWIELSFASSSGCIGESCSHWSKRASLVRKAMCGFQRNRRQQVETMQVVGEPHLAAFAFAIDIGRPVCLASSNTKKRN